MAVSSAAARDADALRLSRALFPDLAARADAALQAPRGAGSGAASIPDVRTDAAEFDARLDAEAARRFAGAGFAALAGTAAGSRFERAFAAADTVARELFAGDAGPLPEPEAFAAAGSDLGRLSEALDADASLVPVPAPYGLGLAAWRAAFRRAARLPGSAFNAGGDTEAIELGTESVREFTAIDRVAGADTPVIAGRPSWALRLVPAAPEPPVLGLNFAQSAPHATLPEMLMLQLMRAVQGDPPLDGGDGRSSFTWLAGELAGGRLAARHVFDAGTIRITAREVGSQGPHLGSRPPIG